MDVHVDEILELLHLGEPLLGVGGQLLALQLALGMEAEQGGVDDVVVDQGVGLARVAVRLLRLVLWGIKVTRLKIAITISPVQTRLATYLTASR